MAAALAIALHVSSAQALIVRLVAAAVEQTPTQVARSLEAVERSSGILVAVSMLSLLWSGSALFSAMDNALSALAGCAPRRFWRKRLMGMAMILVFAALVIPIIASASFLFVHTARLPAAGVPSFLTRTASRVHLVGGQMLLGGVSGTALFLLIYKVVPNRRAPLRAVLPGALLAGAALELLTLLFPLYLHYTESNGTLGALLALPLLLTFFYLVGQLTVVGMLLNLELAARERPAVSATAVLDATVGG